MKLLGGFSKENKKLVLQLALLGLFFFGLLYAALVSKLGGGRFVGLVLGILFPLVYIALLMKVMNRMNKTFLKRLTACLPTFPSKWRTFIHDHSSYYALLDKKTRRRFERDIKILLSEVNIKYECDGEDQKTPSLESRLLIGMGLATLLIGRPGWELPLPKEIVVLPGDRIVKNKETGKAEYAALATTETLFLTEKNLAHSFYRYSDGYNNIFHELAHYFDLEDYDLDGTPSYKRFIKGFKQEPLECKSLWKRILETEFEKARKGELSIRSYATKNLGEFFACATELFFENPGALKNSSSDLYRLLKTFYHFDPLELLQGAPQARRR